MESTAKLLNKEVRDWGKLTRNAMEYRLASLGIGATSRISFRKNAEEKIQLVRHQQLVPSLKVGYKDFYGQINRVSFKMEKHGIFVEHGVGKGRKKGSGKERPKRWIEPVISAQIDGLADILATRDADRVAGQLRYLIPGVIDLRVDVK